MMKQNIYIFIACYFILNLTYPVMVTANNYKPVYTIGAYDEAFAKHATVTKLGPIVAADVPPLIPKLFLEREGNYAGGEAFRTIGAACYLLKAQLAAGLLPKNQSWHIYLLDADWNQDTYKLRTNDFRIKHPVEVVKLVRKKC